MTRRFGWLAAPVALVVAAAAASAATATFPDGKTEKLAVNKEITGPARVVAENGKDSIELRKGAVLRFLGTETDAKGNRTEMFFLKNGAANADLGFYTRLATPSYWAFPEKAGSRAIFYAESFNASTAYARAMKGSSLLRLLVGPATEAGTMEVMLGENQGATLQRGKDGGLGYTTDPHNDWRGGAVRVLYPLGTGLLVDLYVPKATAGRVGPKQATVGKTDVENMVTSWKSGKVRIVTALRGSPTGEGNIGPGVTATIDNASGRIEIGFVKVEFATLKAAVSLTSEFASLATSPIVKP